MGMTVYIDDWNHQPELKISHDVTELYDVSEHKFWGHQEIDGRYFKIEFTFENPFPSMEFASGHWETFSRVLGLITKDGFGSIDYSELHGLFTAVFRFVNSDVNLVSASTKATVNGNIASFGAPPEYLKRTASEFIDLVKFAIDHKKGIYWG